MNKNKIIFAVIWIAILIILIILFQVLASQSGKNKWSWQKSNTDFTIWIVWQDKEAFVKTIKDFTSKSENYKKSVINVVSFENYNDYYLSLIWAFIKWNAPDMFMINNNDWYIFDQSIFGIKPEVINTDNFRKDYEAVFQNDLIRKVKDWDKEVEYLVWLPIWYEILWIYYNLRDAKSKDVWSWADINTLVNEKRNEWKIAIWLWNWSTVKYASDILTQFMLFSWIKDISKVWWDDLKETLWNYKIYWDIQWANQYNTLMEKLLKDNKTNIDAFVSNDVSMILWYPRTLKEIDAKWFSPTYLRADPLPKYGWSDLLLTNYNYLVISKTVKNLSLSDEIMKYFTSDAWLETYLKNSKIFLSPKVTIQDKISEEYISTDYKIKLKNFYRKWDLVSFNKQIKNNFDKETTILLDSQDNNQKSFENLAKSILCISQKINNQKDFEKNCEIK